MAQHPRVSAATSPRPPPLPGLTRSRLCGGLLLSTLETSIIATALISIATSLGDFAQSNWVVVSYLLTYTAFMVIFARISDIFGRKLIFLFSLLLFVVFSLACGLAEDITTLYEHALLLCDAVLIVMQDRLSSLSGNRWKWNLQV